MIIFFFLLLLLPPPPLLPFFLLLSSSACWRCIIGRWLQYRPVTVELRPLGGHHHHTPVKKGRRGMPTGDSSVVLSLQTGSVSWCVWWWLNIISAMFVCSSCLFVLCCTLIVSSRVLADTVSHHCHDNNRPSVSADDTLPSYFMYVCIFTFCNVLLFLKGCQLMLYLLYVLVPLPGYEKHVLH